MLTDILIKTNTNHLSGDIDMCRFLLPLHLQDNEIRIFKNKTRKKRGIRTLGHAKQANPEQT